MFKLKEVRYKNILEIDELEIPKEQITSITGESGSGKSTLLKLLNHMISPDEGEIQFQGEPMTGTDVIQLRRQVVMLSQQPALFADTVRENLQMGLEFSEQPPAAEEQLKEAMQRVNLDKDLDGKADKLSGGEQQRLSLARVLLMDPPVFLLDEPTSALDEDMEELVMERFFEYAKAKNKTVVFVTHTKSLAQQYGDRQVDAESFSRKGR